MAIDTAAKRNSAIATRRLPWMRRFAPIPSVSITASSRQQVAWSYVGIAPFLPFVSTGWFGLQPRARQVVWRDDRPRSREVVWKGGAR